MLTDLSCGPGTCKAVDIKFEYFNKVGMMSRDAHSFLAAAIRTPHLQDNPSLASTTGMLMFTSEASQ